MTGRRSVPRFAPVTPRVLRAASWWLVSFALCGPWMARADLGARVVDESVGPYRVVAYASPTPLREGTTEWTLVALDPATATPARDVRVLATFHPPGEGADGVHGAHPMPGPRVASARDPVATGPVHFTESGPWRVDIVVEGVDAGSAAPQHAGARRSVALEVAARRGFWADYGLALATPYAVIGLAVVYRSTSARRGRQRRRAVRGRRD